MSELYVFLVKEDIIIYAKIPEKDIKSEIIIKNSIDFNSLTGTFEIPEDQSKERILNNLLSEKNIKKLKEGELMIGSKNTEKYGTIPVYDLKIKEI